MDVQVRRSPDLYELVIVLDDRDVVKTHQGKMINSLRALFLLPILLVAGGCLILPFPYSRLEDGGRDFAAEAREFTIVGSTSIEDVLLRFGQPEIHCPEPRYTAQKESDGQSISYAQQEQQTDNPAGKTGTNIQVDRSTKTNWTTTTIVYQRIAAPTPIEVATSPQSSAIKTYANNQFGFIKFDYPGDFSLREERHAVEEATRYKIPLLAVILERTGSYRLDRGTHEYTEVITLGVYNLPESSFHNQTPKIIGNIEWWTSIQTGAEYFMQALTSRGNYTYLFQLHSTKPQWLSFEAPTTDVLERLLSTVSFQ